MVYSYNWLRLLGNSYGTRLRRVSSCRSAHASGLEGLQEQMPENGCHLLGGFLCGFKLEEGVTSPACLAASKIRDTEFRSSASSL